MANECFFVYFSYHNFVAKLLNVKTSLLLSSFIVSQFSIVQKTRTFQTPEPQRIHSYFRQTLLSVPQCLVLRTFLQNFS